MWPSRGMAECAYVLCHGRPQAARHFGVSHHTLWRFLEWGHPGHALPKAGIRAVGDTHDVIAATAWAINASRQFPRRTTGRDP